MRKTDLFRATIRPQAGFSNRIDGIISLWRFQDLLRARGINMEFSINWPIGGVTTGDYGDVILNPMKLRAVDDVTEGMLGWSLWIAKEEAPLDFKVISKDHQCCVLKRSYEDMPQTVIDTLLPYFNRVKWHPYVVEKSEAIKLEPGTIGVHCREADDWDKAGRSLGGVDPYFRMIDSLPVSPIYLVCHHKRFTDAFIARYGNRRITVQPDKDYESHTPRQLQHAIVDMLTLAKMPLLVGDADSSFLHNAWWFGGCKAKVIRLHFKR